MYKHICDKNSTSHKFSENAYGLFVEIQVESTDLFQALEFGAKYAWGSKPFSIDSLGSHLRCLGDPKEQVFVHFQETGLYSIGAQIPQTNRNQKQFISYRA
jgi:hypothetical protein